MLAKALCCLFEVNECLRRPAAAELEQAKGCACVVEDRPETMNPCELIRRMHMGAAVVVTALSFLAVDGSSEAYAARQNGVAPVSSR